MSWALAPGHSIATFTMSAGGGMAVVKQHTKVEKRFDL